jgi:arginyl-tRNA synthetase
MPNKIRLACNEHSPAIVAQYVYDLAKEYNKFYAEKQIFGEVEDNVIQFRVALSEQVARHIKYGMSLLGIHVPDRM